MWKKHKSCFFKVGDYSGRKICAFDYDDTLCSLWTSNPLPNVVYTLQTLSEYYDILIFSNQKGVSLGKSTNLEVQRRFDEFCNNNNLSPTIIYSTKDDEYRKPMDGMWRLSLSLFGEDIQYEYYCGDACGRQGDFSISDLYFANNCNISFRTPEDVFQNKITAIGTNIKKISSLYTKDIWSEGMLMNKRPLIKTKKPFSIEIEPKTLIMMVGPQGSGKSTMAKHILKTYQGGIINRDTQKTVSVMDKEFERLQKEANVIIIDNTNPTLETRNGWRERLPSWNYMILYFDIPKDITFHMTKYRAFYTGNTLGKIPIHTYYKRLEPPTFSECSQLISITKNITEHTMNHNLRFI